MNIETTACVLRSVFLLGVLGVAFKLVYKRAMVDELRYDIGDLRRSLVADAEEASIPVDSPVLAQLKKTLDGVGGCADRITLLRFALADASTSGLLLEISPTEQDVLCRYRERIGKRVFAHLVAVSPVLWPLALFLEIARYVVTPVQRLCAALLDRVERTTEVYCGGRFLSAEAYKEVDCENGAWQDSRVLHSATWPAAPKVSQEPCSSQTRVCGSKETATRNATDTRLSSSGEHSGR